MDGRERILAALRNGTPDRVPCALGFYHVDLSGLPQPSIDVQFVRFPLSPEDQQLIDRGRPYPPDTRLGTADQMATYARWGYRPQEPSERNPLSRARTLQELQLFPFPDVGRAYHVPGLADQVRELHSQGLAAGGNLPHLGGELFETAWRLRGLEQFLLDMVERPAWAHLLLDRLTDMARRNAQTMAHAGVDVLILDDDVGMPGTMMISPSTWRTFFKPRMLQIIDAARAVKPDLCIVYHSDGHFAPIIDDLIEIGFDGINPLQPEHMDAARIRRRYGPRLALWGTVGAQNTFHHATPEAIAREVRDRIETLGHDGLILSPAYDVDEPGIPRSNVTAFLEAVQRMG